MKPTGTGSVEIAPTNTGTLDNLVIGGITPKAITATSLTTTTGTISTAPSTDTDIVNKIYADGLAAKWGA
jgi:hypothetical protein